MIDYKEQPHLNPEGYYPMEGPAGAQGPAGPQGVAGPQGPTGPQGPRGLQGERGPRGPMGEIGPQGVQGPKGDRGDAGRNGEQGPQGPMGPRGFTGADGKVAFEKLTPEQVESLRGPEGPQGERGPQGLRGFDGATGMQGPEGPMGPAGPQGAQGPAGPTGERGPIGPQGLRGATGPAGKDGATVTTEHVTTEGVWNSKNVVDYNLHGQTEWTNHVVNWGADGTHKVTGTANGYAKNAKIYGYTMTNYSTMTRKEKVEQVKQKYTDAENTVIEVYNKTKSGNTALVEDNWTLIYTLDGIKLFEGTGEQTAWAGIRSEIVIHVEGSGVSNPVIIEPKEAVNGVIKKRLIVPRGQRISKIEIKPITPISDEASESLTNTLVSYTVKDVLLLRDNYEFKIPPRYFYGTRGVGTEVKDESGKFNIEVESRNKNLIDENKVIDNYYLAVDAQQSPEPRQVRWSSAAIGGSVASFLVYCKPSTQYTFSSTIIDEKRARLVVCEYDDDPFNGEPATITHAQTTEGMLKGPEKLTFTTSSHTNILAFYLGNFEQGERNINTIHDKIQLEEGPVETSYEPYRSIKKNIKINKQLQHNEILYWNKNKNKYYIHEQTAPDQFRDVETDVIVEELIHTYDGTTYVYVNSKIPSKVEAEFPIKAHNDYYTKEQVDSKNAAITTLINNKLDTEYYKRKAWALRDDDLTEELNFLGLPNGVRMQWKRVQLAGDGQHQTVEFKALGTIYTVMATPYNAQSTHSNAFLVVTRVKNEEGSEGNPWPKIDIWAKTVQGAQANYPVYAQVLAIGSNETYKPPAAAKEEN